jgi:alkylhydroperoxidase/carboxymuconolactone decarboxylase family protein YurZ
MANEQRAKGLESMEAVYGTRFVSEREVDEASPYSRPLVQHTTDHLFPEVWARPALSVRDRRLLTLGVTGSSGRSDLVELQLLGALRAGELDEEQIGELVLHLAYYAGWPNAVAFQEGARRALERFREEV